MAGPGGIVFIPSSNHMLIQHSILNMRYELEVSVHFKIN